jgi:hypothetical protein
LGEATGAPADGADGGAAQGEWPAVALEVKEEEAQVVGVVEGVEVFHEALRVAADARALGDGRLHIQTDLHGG